MKKKFLYACYVTATLALSTCICSPSFFIQAEGNIDEILEEKTWLNTSNLDGVPIQQIILPYSQEHRPMVKMAPKYITIHNTGNDSVGATAEMHSIYLHGQTHEKYLSWHFTVDDSEIIQHLPLNEIGYHAGDADGDGNYRSIGIEICENADGNYAQAERNAAKLVAEILYEYNMSVDQVVPHQHWSGKDCPYNMLHGTKESLGWDGFLSLISKELTSIILQNAQVDATTNALEIQIGTPQKLELYTTTSNENYTLYKNGYEVSIDKNENVLLQPIVNKDVLKYKQDIYRSSSNDSLVKSSLEFYKLLSEYLKQSKNKNDDETISMNVTGDKIIDKKTGEFISSGLSQLSFVTPKGVYDFDIYSYIEGNPIITTNIESFVLTGSSMNLLNSPLISAKNTLSVNDNILANSTDSIVWEVENEEIAEIKNGEIIGKREGNTRVYARVNDNIILAREISVK